MSSLQQLYSMISSLNEKFNQLEQNSKRIFELPENSILSGSSKFAISRPLDTGERTEYTTLNSILEWCIEEIQNIENATRLVQMLPPELLSSPRRIRIPVVRDSNDIPIIWKILGVQYSVNTEQTIPIPDAEDDNYRKDLILGTQTGDIIRFPGPESNEGIIEPVQPENTVLLTSMTLLGNVVTENPTEPINGSLYVSKSSQNWVLYTLVGSATYNIISINNIFSINIFTPTAGKIIRGFSTTGSSMWAGTSFHLRCSGEPVLLLNITSPESLGGLRFVFRDGNDCLLTQAMGVLEFKRVGNQLFCLNYPAGSGGSSVEQWDNEKIYQEGQNVYYGTAPNIGIYSSRTNGNLGFQPDTSTDDWLLISNRSTNLSVVTISSNTTLSSEHNGKILMITGAVILTIPSGLASSFVSCVIDIKSGSLTVATSTGVTVSGAYSLTLNVDESASLYKESPINNLYRLK